MSDKALSSLTGIGTLAAGDTGSLVYLIKDGNSRGAKLGRVKDIAALAPADSNFMVGDGNTWVVESGAPARTSLGLGYGVGVRERLTVNRTYYVRPNGIDTNTGLADTAGGAFLTLQKAWNVIVQTLDLNGYNATIKAADGTYTAGIRSDVDSVGYLPVGGNVFLEGNTSTPGNCIISTTNTFCIRMQDAAKIYVKGVRLTTSSSGSGMSAASGGVIYGLNAIEFGTCPDAHMQANRGGLVLMSNAYAVVGNADRHWEAYQGGVIVDGDKTITLSGTPAMTTAWAYAHRGGKLDLSGNTFSGSGTGKRFAISGGSVLKTGVASLTYLPGDVAGTYYSATLDEFNEPRLRDSDGSHGLLLKTTSDLTADRDLTVVPGDAARTVTLSGNPTLADWFDQSVKAAASPQLAGVNLGHASDTLLARVSAGLASIAGVTIALISAAQTLTSKTINLASNTLTGTAAEFNTALSDANFYVTGGTDVAVADGGTGASDAATARTNLGVGMALLASGSASGASLDIALTAYTAYRGIIVELYGFVPATDATSLYVRFSTDGGATYDATGYNYAAQVTIDSTAEAGLGSASANQMVIAEAIGNASTEGYNGSIKLMGQTSAALWSRITHMGYVIDSTATPQGRHYLGGGARETAQDTNGIQFLFASGNIASGSYAVYGLH